jgi:hypothetical protein
LSAERFGREFGITAGQLEVTNLPGASVFDSARTTREHSAGPGSRRGIPTMPAQLAESTDGEIRRYIQAVLKCNEEYDAAQAAEIDRLEAEGYRIVDGGQVDRDPETNESTWQITDWRTGETLASGSGDDEFITASDALEAQHRGYHIDHVLEDSEAEAKMLRGPEVPQGMPESLAQVLGDWATDNEDDARAWGANDSAY